MIGERISHYRIVEKIGEGGMGEVYLAEDLKLKRRVALKFLHEAVTRDEGRRRRFIQEARAAATIEHPHIGAIHDIEEVEGRTFIVMEYVPGKSLRELSRRQRLPLRKAVDLAIQIADGIAKAHERGVVHRDLKPENIIVSEDGYAKIIDFGLAKLLEPLTATTQASSMETDTRVRTREGLILGTVPYMSPEQARGEPVDARSDIFSFGLLLHEMLTGRPAFRRRSAVETLNAVIKEDPPPLEIAGDEVPADLQRIVRKCLVKDRAARYQSIKDVAVDLRELRDFLSSGARPATVRSRHPRWRLLVAGGILTVALLAAAVYLVRRAPSPAPAIGVTGRPAIAVMYFEDHSGAEEIHWLAGGLPSMLITGLAQTPGLDVISSQRIQEILKDIGRDNLEQVDRGIVTEVARRAGAGAVVVGSIFKSGPEIRLDVQIEDVSSGRVLSAETVRGRDVFPLVDELTGRIRARLELSDRAAGLPIAEVTTSSLKAWRHYTKGRHAALNLRFFDALDEFQKAVDIDPSFALAYFRLAEYDMELGRPELAESYYRKVMEQRDRLPRRQRLLVEARYAEAVEGRPEKAARILEELVSDYPDEQEGHIRLGIVLRKLHRREAELAALEGAVRALPESGPIRNAYGYALLARGRYDDAIEQFETYARLEPDEPNPYDSLGEAYLVTGQLDAARKAYDKALSVDPTFLIAHSGRAWSYVIEGRFDEALEAGGQAVTVPQERNIPWPAADFANGFALARLGRYGEAEKLVRRGIETSKRQKQVVLHAELELLSALLALERERYAAVVDRVGRAEKILPSVTSPSTRDRLALLAHLLAGTAAARSGDIEGARRRLDAQSSLVDSRSEVHRWFFHSLEAEIALAQGDPDAAERAFREGLPEHHLYFSNADTIFSILANCLPQRDVLARIAWARGDLSRAVALYRVLNTPGTANPWTAMFEPRYVLETARLLDEMGEKDAGRKEYGRFLEYWKKADPLLPELLEARRGSNVERPVP